MSFAASKKDQDSKPHCLVHTVANALATEPALEAVTLNRKQQAISVAILGERKNPELLERIAARVQEAREANTGQACGLLEGESDCEHCAVPFAPFERQSIRIQHEADSTTIARVTCPTAPRFWHWREIPWPKFGPREIELPEEDEHAEEWKPQLGAAFLCALFGLTGFFLRDHWIGIVSFIFAYLFGSWFAAKEVGELLQKRKLDVHFLMLAVAFGSASIGAWSEGATLLFLFSFSGALEHYAMGRTQREIRSLFKAAPKVALLLDGKNGEREISVDQLEVGMRLLIKPDSQFPVDAEIVQGESASDESNLTGESLPVQKNIGDTVLAGTLNLWGALEVTVLRPARESALQKIIHLIKEAQHLKAPAQRFTDKFGTRYTYGILGLALGIFFVWWLVFNLPPFTATASSQSAFYRAMTLLVVASPCALVLSIPSAVLAAIAWGARHGILFRGGAAVEKLAEITLVALDKTGTLTTGELKVERIESFPAGRENEIAQLAYSLEKLSTHPLARAVTRHGKKLGLNSLELTSVESISGLGMKARLGEQSLLLGRREWLAQNVPAHLFDAIPATEVGFSEVWLAMGNMVGRILLRDDLRPQSRSVITKLQHAGIKTVALTGDRAENALILKTKLDLNDVRAGLKPNEKVSIIHSFTKNGERVAMIGDGVNDAPSLAAAHVGVAMGARGSDAALEQAEVVLMHDRLENFWAAFRLSQRARKIIRQNLFISLGTVVLLVGFAMAGKIPLTLGVIGHEGSTVIVVLNSLRLLISSKED